jgi:hypothetical protein
MSAGRIWRLRVAGVVIASCVGLGLPGAGSALAETKTFATQACETWEVPAGVSSVAIQATGAAGGRRGGSATVGKGDGFSAVLSGLLHGEDLFVCVDEGGGAGGLSEVPALDGGPGGGASGVSRGSDFASPVLIAAGGGGAGGGGSVAIGAGGNAGEAGKDGEATGSGGGAGTETKGGAGGKGAQTFGAGANGLEGEKFSALGPGHGGAGGEPGGGGGGGGYYGGGGGGDEAGGAGGGGGGGSDFCANGASSCARQAEAGTKPEAGTAEGDAKVTLTYTVSVPTSIAQCMKNGWKNFGSKFKNQGQCVKFVETGR